MMAYGDQYRQDEATAGGRPNSSTDVRQRAIQAFGGARQSVAEVGRRAGDRLDEAPLIVLGAGFAVGALLAAILPRTDKEEELLRPVADRVKQNARAAAQAARDAGTGRLRELGLTPDSGRDVVRTVVDGISDAARASAQAAVGSVRGKE
jgi:hypothetical protein